MSFSPEHVVGRLLSSFTLDFTSPTRREIAVADTIKGLLLIYGDIDCQEEEAVQVNCDDCCEEDLCNANFSVQYYQEMMSRQYTSWFVPLPGEISWNRKNDFKFPY
ncbi:unnamed protein product [Heligmosomoides polygyrus]|uniref:Uncharacterized protein n=1 Tax=Heligmosomoides polygyrus TaxID=6339 RepID=A0A183G168_HELPZ|nr:unnamed protein product [Heligmosomoides polygyrus]